jgi:hypothetical protein
MGMPGHAGADGAANRDRPGGGALTDPAIGHERSGDNIAAKQAKMRQQLIERGQMVSQGISYDGFTTHFGVVPVTDVIERKLDRIHQGIAVARRELLKQGKKGLAERIAAFEATYTKAFLERSRLPEAIQLANRALDSYRGIRKQEYFNKFRQLRVVEGCFGWNGRLCGRPIRVC